MKRKLFTLATALTLAFSLAVSASADVCYEPNILDVYVDDSYWIILALVAIVVIVTGIIIFCLKRKKKK